MKTQADASANEAPRIDLKLAKTQSIQGRLFLKDKPIAGVQCKVCVVVRPLKVDSEILEGSLDIHPGTGIQGFWVSAMTDQEGRFSLEGYPADCELRLQLEKENLGSATTDLSVGKPTDWELEEPGNLVISIEGETGPIPLRNLTLDEIVSGNELRPQGRNVAQLALVNSIHRKGLSAPTTGEAHKGTYQLNVPVDPTLPYHFGPSQVVKIEPGKSTSVVLKKMPLAYCSGRILDAKTGKGIANLSVQLDGTKEWNEKRPDASKFTETIHAKTDRNGRYSIPCRGDHTYVLNFDCSEYDCEHFRDWDGDRARIPILPHQVVAPGEKAAFPDLLLIPARSITGTITDDAGKPAEGPIVVHSFTKRSTGEVPYQLDKEKLTLTQLASDLPLPVFIRKGNSVNVPTVLPVKPLESPFAFTISEKHQVRAVGKIVDEQGKPILMARALILWLAPFPSKPVSVGDSEGGWLVPEQSAFTDKQGAFSTGGLWPGAKYHLQVSAEGYRKWSSIDGFKTPGRKAEPAG